MKLLLLGLVALAASAQNVVNGVPNQNVTTGAGNPLQSGFALSAADGGNHVSTGIAAMITACGAVTSCSIIVPPSYPTTESVPGQSVNYDGQDSVAGTTSRNVLVIDNRFGNYQTQINPLGKSFGNSYLANNWNFNYYTPPAAPFANMIGLALIQNSFDGGTNTGANKINWLSLVLSANSWTLGQVIGHGTSVYHYGNGDSIIDSGTVHCFGGYTANTDEGCEIRDEHAYQGNVAFAGTLTGSPTTGALSVTVSPTQGINTQGQGRFLLNTSSGKTLTGNLAAIATAGGSLTTITGASTTWPLSTVIGTLGTTVVAGSATVTPTFSTGTIAGITTSSKICIADNEQYEQAQPTAVSSPTFTATFLHPHPSTAVISVGGLCGYAMALTADNVTSASFTGNVQAIVGTLRRAWPLLYSSSTTSAKVWVAGGGALQQMPTMFDASTAAGYTMYPMAETVSVQQAGGLSNTLTLGANSVAWAASDTVEQPLYPAWQIGYGQRDMESYMAQFPGAASGGPGMDFRGVWTFPSALMPLTNHTPSSFYTKYQPPFGILIDGATSYGLTFNVGPTNGGVAVGCPNDGCVHQFYNVLRKTGADDVDAIRYDERAGHGTWNFTSHGATNSVSLPDLNGTAGVFTGSTTSGHCLQAGTTGEITDSGAPCPASRIKTVYDFGAVGDGVQRKDGSCTSGSPTFTSALGTFVSGDVGKDFQAVGCAANGGTLHASISARASANSITLSVNAGSTVVGTSRYAYGHDDGAHIQACLDGVGAYGTCVLPAINNASCPTFAKCGYIAEVTDQATGHAPGALKLRYPGLSFVGQGGMVPVFTSGWGALYTNSISHPSVTALIRGNGIGIGDPDGPLGINGQELQNVRVAWLDIDGMTNGNTFQGAFDPTQPPCTTTFDCWDETHKGIFAYGGTTVDNIQMDHLSIHDYKGEIVFSGGGMGRASISDFTLANSNADGISWSADDFVAERGTISNIWNAAVENGIFSTTKHHVYRNLNITDMWGQGIVLPGVSSTTNSGPLEILNNTFTRIGSQGGHNSSTTLAAIYLIGQIGTCSGGSDCAPPSNIVARGNQCTDCFVFAWPNTTGHAEFIDNSFCVDTAGLYNVFTLYNPASDLVIRGNHGCVTPAAISASKALVTVYLFNPGFGTLTYKHLNIRDNEWNFDGSSTEPYTFTTSSGSGFASITNKYPTFQNENCIGCNYVDTNNGRQDLNASSTIKPVGPEVHVFDNVGPVTATIDASKSENYAQVVIVNIGTNAVSLANDANMSLASTIVLAQNEQVTLRFNAALGKWTLMVGK